MLLARSWKTHHWRLGFKKSLFFLMATFLKILPPGALEVRIFETRGTSTWSKRERLQYLVVLLED